VECVANSGTTEAPSCDAQAVTADLLPGTDLVRASAMAEPWAVEYRPGAVRITASFVVLTAMFFVGCSGGGAASPSPASLDGRTFLSTRVQGHDLVPGSTVRMRFQGGQLGISAGCNQMSGKYAIVDGRLTTGQMAMTEMACDEPRMAQDTWVAAFVGGAAVTLAGDMLTLKNADVTLTLTDREVADPDRPLQGTRWVLDGIVSGDAVSSVPAGVTATLTISDGQMQVETGCNTGSASVAVTDTTLTIGPLGLTKKACVPEAMAVEQAVTSVLSGKVDYAIKADALTLTASGAGLTLRAAS
jgi:heat shock protein HslJ